MDPAREDRFVNRDDDPIYIAGPLFDDGERWWIEQVDAAVQAAGFTTFLPHRDNPPKTADNVDQIFATNVAAIDRASIVVANLNGITTDDGTAWEVGYAFASSTYLVGIHTDSRRRFDDEIVNLMLERSVDVMVHSLEELTAHLRNWNPPPT
jgi:nucleoside 2-deoxyribosyltransferase